MYRRAERAAPKRTDIVEKLGFTLLAAGDIDAAATVFEKALQTAPTNVSLLRGVGTAALMGDRPDLAATSFRRAIAAAPRFDHRLYSGLGIALDMKGQHKAAQAAYRDGLRRAPRNITLANNFALSLALEGDFARAIRILRQVVDADGATAMHRQNLALVYALSGDMAAARRVAGQDMNQKELDARIAHFRWLRTHPSALGKELRPKPSRPAGTPAPDRGRTVLTPIE